MKITKKIVFPILIIILIFLLIKCVSKINNRKETFTNQNYMCFMCVKLTPELLNFANNFKKNYKVFIMVDNNDIKFTSQKQGINILQIDDQKCIDLGYQNASATLKKNPVTWDKVFYYFGNIDTNFNHIWFIEEDVFVPRYNFFTDLDHKYPSPDLLCKNDIPEATDKQTWHWSRARGKIKKPWFRSLLCCHRQSRRNLQKVKEYVDQNGSLLFLEFMINTIAHHNNFQVQTIPQFNNIVFKRKKKYTFDEVDLDNLYHPIKDLKTHIEFREKLGTQ